MDDYALVLNAESSNLKFCVFRRMEFHENLFLDEVNAPHVAFRIFEPEGASIAVWVWYMRNFGHQREEMAPLYGFARG